VPDDLIAEHAGQYLSMKQVSSQLQNCKTQSDSISKIEEIKNTWLKHQLIISKAEKELPSSDLQIDLDLLQYKADLLRYKYDNYYINKKINTQVSQQAVEVFYEENKSVLQATETLVKSVYIEIPTDIKDRYKAKQWLSSTNEKDQDKLKVYCFQHANVFDDFENQWVALESLQKMSQSPLLIESKIKENKIVEYQTESTTYYILINEIINRGDIMPLEYAKDKIVTMIINNRKRDLRKELDNKLNEQVANL
jgi:hypothetical protein